MDPERLYFLTPSVEQVQESKSIPLRYMFDKNFTRNYFKSTILTSFNELQAGW